MPWWLWPTLLSLDAPLVALVWQDFLARCFPSLLLPAGRVALGLTVWAIYLADRLLDTRAVSNRADGIPHSYYRRYRGAGVALLAMVLLADAFVALFWLRPQVLASGWWTALAVLLYLSAYPLARWRNTVKPVAAAALFTWGVFLVASTGPRPLELVQPAAVFCALCLTNMLVILRKRAAVALALLLAIACLAFGDSRFYTAVGLSSAALAGLTKLRTSPMAHRVLVDAVLLSPLLFAWMPTV